ncbi:polysaccharide pyruvyl transferase family protein [Butyrivibrio sp. JL13D10]|uniref:polysaccharide pyruvyl transferase family protein n=1 Tax=Butyrivibrio sp. JL13D10 TaxID=3236815 RepID=UPI0038B642F6
MKMRKTAGIITIWDLWNLGNRLQNYAVTYIAKENGLSPETLVLYESGKKDRYDLVKALVYNIIFFISKGKNIKSMVWLRAKKFRKFSNSNIPFRYVKSDEQDNYDYILIGSDQIWNAEVIEPTDFIYGNGLEVKKIICIAPSFGVTGFNSNVETKIAEYLKKIDYLNVREYAGAKLIERITKKKVPVFLDPTLIVPVMEWQKIEKKPHNIANRKYILKYFLGEEAAECIHDTERLCIHYGYEVISLLDKNNPNAFIVGPSEFLYLIHNAEMILTDSFHACVFSIHYKKPFWVYSRTGEHMNSRMNTLFEKLQIDNRFEHDMSKPFDIDYHDIDSKLADERKRFNEFFEKAISGK